MGIHEYEVPIKGQTHNVIIQALKNQEYQVNPKKKIKISIEGQNLQAFQIPNQILKELVKKRK
jgi:hypothetical protein